MRSCKCLSYGKLYCISLKVFFSISTLRLPIWDFVSHHGHICFFSVSLVMLSPARAAFFAGVLEDFLTGFRSTRVQLPSTEPTQVRLSREGFLTGYQTVYRFWVQRTKLGCHTAEVSSQGECSITPQDCSTVVQQKRHAATTCHSTFMKPLPGIAELCYGCCKQLQNSAFQKRVGPQEFTLLS